MRVIVIVALSLGVALIAGGIIVTLVSIATKPTGQLNNDGTVTGTKLNPNLHGQGGKPENKAGVVAHMKQEKPKDHCSASPCQNNGTCKNTNNGYKCTCVEGYDGDQCENAPFVVDVKFMSEIYEEEMSEKGSPAFNKFVKKHESAVEATCRAVSGQCEVGGLRAGSVIMEIDVTSSTGDPATQITQALQLAGETDIEVSSVQQYPGGNGPCQRLKPCQNGGSCTNKGYFNYKCCCQVGWSGEHCDEPVLPEGPPLECRSDDDIRGVNYNGTQSKTTSGRICQPWSQQYPHRHSFKNFKELGLRENYCRNKVGGINGDYRPWCFTMDPKKRFEYCDNIPLCSDKDEIIPDPPDDFGCHNSTTYIGEVDFTESGKRCDNWKDYGYHDVTGNYCRKTENGVSKRPWCWTKEGEREDCDIRSCARPRLEVLRKAKTAEHLSTDIDSDCKILLDSSSACESRTVLLGNCSYEFNKDKECGFTVTTEDRNTYTIYTQHVTRQLHWLRYLGLDRYSYPNCSTVFEVTGPPPQLVIRQPLCGTCSMLLHKSHQDDVSTHPGVCPVLPGQI